MHMSELSTDAIFFPYCICRINTSVCTKSSSWPRILRMCTVMSETCPTLYRPGMMAILEDLQHVTFSQHGFLLLLNICCSEGYHSTNSTTLSNLIKLKEIYNTVDDIISFVFHHKPKGISTNLFERALALHVEYSFFINKASKVFLKKGFNLKQILYQISRMNAVF